MNITSVKEDLRRLVHQKGEDVAQLVIGPLCSHTSKKSLIL